MENYSVRRINRLLESFKGSTRYLEVGVESGSTFFDVSATFKTAVDPSFQFDSESAKRDHPSCEFIEVTSDNFFSTRELKQKFDLVFLDGLHTWDQTYRDFCNALLFTHERSIILLDDIFPSDVYSCNRDQVEAVLMRQFMSGDAGNAWHGDTYKIVPLIDTFHPLLDFCTIISDGNPQTIVWRSTESRCSRFDLLEREGNLNIAALDYLWFLRNQTGYVPMEEEAALGLVISSLV
ncbi:class I SAM-dependent methyltransferase [Cyanobium gracile UHCC 0139]|uniref:Class I SAM-dependent methyltransferase n=1 Tax=Cyanobium gracile UHCC 0139 TaxID=3110308 RepID=A0ABU5RUL6_9CYAN|nr:class I SAM-dependent methyltransferase [Cyanobium gracile]MEA5391459.1 class I SAM-dependent methyltransferase [Cyanobium gracile UHCC 0139]